MDMKPTASASRRTKNRCKEHRLIFDPAVRSDNIMGFEGRDMIYAKCSDPKCPAFGTPWMGWIPVDELEQL